MGSILFQAHDRMEPAMTRGERQNLGTGLLFISPWLVGFLALCVYQVVRQTLHVLNGSLRIHFAPPNWLQESRYAKWGIIFTGLWSVGNAVVIYLAGLQDVPRQLYESADIDGATFWSKTRHITLPIL